MSANNATRLVEITEQLELMQEQLAALDPELYAEIERLRSERDGLIESAKVDLREMGVGTHKIGKFSFKVAAGSVKKEYDVAAIEDRARELGHENILRQYKVFKLVVDPSQIERLPPEIKGEYSEMYDSVTQNAKVTMPKGF